MTLHMQWAVYTHVYVRIHSRAYAQVYMRIYTYFWHVNIDTPHAMGCIYTCICLDPQLCICIDVYAYIYMFLAYEYRHSTCNMLYNPAKRTVNLVSGTNLSKFITVVDTHFCSMMLYGVASISRLLKIVGLACGIWSLLQGPFAKETYHFKEPTNRSHPIRKVSLHAFRFSGTKRGGGLGSRPKKMCGERLGDGVEYHLMKPTPRR